MSEWAKLLRNYKILTLIAVLAVSLASISFNGLSYGIDFNGGTQFQIELKNSFSSDAQRTQIISIISQRLDATGLQDITVSSWGDKYIIAQVAQTNPETIARIEELLKRQGRFEATLDGNVLFTGSDFIQIFQDASKGYGVADSGNGLFEWTLPFLLKNAAAKNFTEKTFHQCTIIGYDPSAGRQFDCKKTYFFIDRPAGSIIAMPSEQFSLDSQLLLQGNVLLDIPQSTKMNELVENAQIEVIKLDQNFSEQDKNNLMVLFASKKEAVIPSNLDQNLRNELTQIGFELREIDVSPSEPWIWHALGARQVISLTPSVTNLEPFVESPKDAVVYSELVIRGSASSQEEAFRNLENLAILLQSGSLPIPVKDISKESISPTLGEEFLFTMLFVGIIVTIVVSLVIFIRYKEIKITIPIIITILSETIIVLGFAAFAKWNLDLASLTGLIAAIGTGVGDQIVITDELSKGVQAIESANLVNRVKRAFFIVMASASTSIAALLPILVFGFGLGKLTGFAITTIAGVLVGVLITRPAFGEMARVIFTRK